MIDAIDETVALSMQRFIELAMRGEGDSDRHVIALFGIALASRGGVYIELGVRSGVTTLPILAAAYLNRGRLISVDKEPTSFQCPEPMRESWQFVQSDAIDFLSSWDSSQRVDFIYVDDWHAYRHVKHELEIIDRMIGPSSVVLLHDLMWGNHDPFYHCDLTLKSGQWAEGGAYRAVSDLDPQFWEWSTLPWSNGLTLLRKKYSSRYHNR